VKPNLFQFATSELSQDAILCWLAAWADPGSAEHDQGLHGLGQAFLKIIFEKHGKEVPDIRTPIKITRQHRGIDVLLVINDSIALCIEDKVGTTEHSEQLQRYLAGLKEDGFSEDQIIPVYVQTGEQGSYRGVKAAGYSVMRRGELITLVREYLDHGGSDSVARDFHNYLADIDRRVEAFRTRPFSEWESYAWQGFYSEVQHQLGDGDWATSQTPRAASLAIGGTRTLTRILSNTCRSNREICVSRSRSMMQPNDLTCAQSGWRESSKQGAIEISQP
jgi:hypothetical protein